MFRGRFSIGLPNGEGTQSLALALADPPPSSPPPWPLPSRIPPHLEPPLPLAISKVEGTLAEHSRTFRPPTFHPAKGSGGRAAGGDEEQVG